MFHAPNVPHGSRVGPKARGRIGSRTLTALDEARGRCKDYGIDDEFTSSYSSFGFAVEDCEARAGRRVLM